jgi:hypothetical protein
MSNYREEEISTTMKKWRRAYYIGITNDYNTIPIITFHEEDVIEFPVGKLMRTGMSQVYEKCTDPSEVFDTINPYTGEKVGEASYQDLQLMIYSMYLHLAKKRDNAKKNV